jgi:hypothetical protein
MLKQTFRRARLVLLLAVFSSCAWNRGELAKWFSSEKGVSDAQLKDVGARQEDLEKFAIKEAPVTPSAATAEEKTLPTTAAKPPVKANRPRAVAPVVKKGAPPKPTENAGLKEFAYPADFPEELKKLDEQTAKTWKLFRPVFDEQERMMLDIDYMGMTVGKVIVGYKGIKLINEKPVHHFQAFFKSAPFYSAIYEIDDQLDTFVDQETFVSRRFNLVQRESSQDVDEVQLYDSANFTTRAYQKTVRKGKVKTKEWEGPLPRYSLDALSVLWLIRGLPLKTGDTYIVPVVNKGETLRVTTNVEGREKLKLKTGEVNTIRIQASTQYTGRTLKSGDMILWFRDDEKRTLVRMKAKIKLGSIYGELASGK